MSLEEFTNKTEIDKWFNLSIEGLAKATLIHIRELKARGIEPKAKDLTDYRFILNNLNRVRANLYRTIGEEPPERPFLKDILERYT